MNDFSLLHSFVGVQKGLKMKRYSMIGVTGVKLGQIFCYKGPVRHDISECRDTYRLTNPPRKPSLTSIAKLKNISS